MKTNIINGIILILSILSLFQPINCINLQEKQLVVPDDLLPSRKGKSDEKHVNDISHFSGYLTIQRLYSGNDLRQSFLQNEYVNTKKFFVLNQDLLFFTNSIEEIGNVEDQIAIRNIYNKSQDDYLSGRCCKNITFRKFPNNYECKGTCPNYRTVEFIPSLDNMNEDLTKSEQEDINPDPTKISKGNWTYCVEIFVYFEIRWRICSENEAEILLFQKTLGFLVFNSLFVSMSINAETLIKFEEYFVPGQVPKVPQNWNWRTQILHWPGNCQVRNVMQSPINIYDEILIPEDQDKDFTFEIEFYKSQFLIAEGVSQRVVEFTEKKGIFVFCYKKNCISYQPTGLEFRVPQEHTINKHRNNGNIIIKFKELDKNQSIWMTEGLEIEMPITWDENCELPPRELHHLDTCLWDFVFKKEHYHNRKYHEFKDSNLRHDPIRKFDLKQLWERMQKLVPKYYFYIGSQTTPPCLDYVTRVVIDKPVILDCYLFLDIKTKSLIKDGEDDRRVPNLHARLIQNDCEQMNDHDRSICIDKKPPHVYLFNDLPPPIILQQCKCRLH